MTASPPLLALQRRRPGTFAVLMAATCLLMLLAAALALSLRAAAREVGAAATQRLLVQIVDADRGARDAAADEAMARLAQIRTVFSARRMPEREARALIAPYIDGMTVRELPVPVLIEVRAADGAAVTAALRAIPTVQISDAGAALGPLARLIDALRAVALGIAIAAALATGLIAMLSARAALAREGATLEILHTLGATDRQLSRLVTGKIARDAAIGAAGGLGAALLVIATIASRVAAIEAGIDMHWSAGGWIILVLLTIALVGLATLAAQGALLAALRRAP